MFEFTETIDIEATPARTWDLMEDVERWWPASNAEHDHMERLDDDGPLGVGTKLRIRERIGGIPGEAVGTITEFERGAAVTWEAPEAQYRLLGMRVTVGEGVTWRIEDRGSRSRVSAHVWAAFPAGRLGRLIEWGFTTLGGVQKDRAHTRAELGYLKRALEIPETGNRLGSL